MPQTPFGGGSIVGADIAPDALVDDVDERLAVERQRHRPPQFGIVERRLVQVDQHRARHVADIHLADRLRRLLLEVLQRRDRHAVARMASNLPAKKARLRGAVSLHDREFDAVEIRPALLPVIRVLRHLDVLVRLELDEFERPGADRVLPHLARPGRGRDRSATSPRRAAPATPAAAASGGR